MTEEEFRAHDRQVLAGIRSKLEGMRALMRVAATLRPPVGFISINFNNARNRLIALMEDVDRDNLKRTLDVMACPHSSESDRAAALATCEISRAMLKRTKTAEPSSDWFSVMQNEYY